MMNKNLKGSIFIDKYMAFQEILNALMSFKELSETQAKALIEILKQQRVMTKKEIDDLLNKSRICVGNSSYQVVDDLVHKEVLFEKDGKYEPIDTNLLIRQCNISITKLI